MLSTIFRMRYGTRCNPGKTAQHETELIYVGSRQNVLPLPALQHDKAVTDVQFTHHRR